MFESKLPGLTTSIFSQMTALANAHNAINLSQGFPEFDAPDFLKQAINQAISAGLNQYAPSSGLPELQEAIAALVQRKYQVDIAPQQQVTVTSGATEALFVAIQACVRPNDEVIVFDPAYDSYEPAVNLAGGHCKHIALQAPNYRIDWQQVADTITGKTRLIIINSPHNPTGSMLSQADLDQLALLVKQHNLLVISDEVYEHIVFDHHQHLSLIAQPELAAHSFVIASFGKTFHCTGWKMGYCIAPAKLTNEFRKIHQYVTFSSFTPAQRALTQMLQQSPEHVDDLRPFYQQKRDLMTNALAASRFKILPCKGTYFILLDYRAISDLPDVEFCHWLVEQHGVAAIPLSVFNHNKQDDKIIRLCFAKTEQTLRQAAEKLCQL